MDTTDHGPRGPPGQANAAERSLPYPYITQFDEQQQATFFANAETGETSWEPPNVSSGHGGAGYASSTRGMGSAPQTMLDGPSPSPNGPAPAVQGTSQGPVEKQHLSMPQLEHNLHLQFQVLLLTIARTTKQQQAATAPSAMNKMSVRNLEKLSVEVV